MLVDLRIRPVITKLPKGSRKVAEGSFGEGRIKGFKKLPKGSRKLAHTAGYPQNPPWRPKLPKGSRKVFTSELQVACVLWVRNSQKGVESLSVILR